MHQVKFNSFARVGLVILSILALFALFSPIFSPYTYHGIQLADKNMPPCARHWFGTDALGRDLLTRLAYGARISIFVGITAAFIDMCIGVTYGAIAATSSKRVDEIMMRFADILYCLPYILVTVLLLVIFGAGLPTLILALTFTGWINMARIVRGEILQIKQRDYVLIAKAQGASFFRILFRHLIPGATGTILTTVTLTIPTAIFMEAFLSFLGLGIQAPIASWGTMASDGLSAMRYYPWRLFFPAGFICITMLAFNIVGDGLRDVFDPRYQG